MAQPVLLLADMLSGWGAATACARTAYALADQRRERSDMAGSSGDATGPRKGLPSLGVSSLNSAGA